MIAAIALLAGTGGGYRLLQARYADLANAISVEPGSLSVIPIQIGEWHGVDIPMDENVIQATDTDDHVNRSYVRGRDAVGLYVAMGVKIRDLLPHRPEVCYSGAGWNLVESQLETITLDDGTTFDCMLQQFTRGSLSNERINVLHYYIVDDAYSADVSLLRKTAWRFDKGPHYSAQVHLVASGDLSGHNATMLAEFAQTAAKPIRDGVMKAVAKAKGNGQADEGMDR